MIHRRSIILMGVVFTLMGFMRSPRASTSPASSALSCFDRTGQIVLLSIDSQIYQASIPISLYLPPCYSTLPESVPAIYLLHGANTDQTQWPDLNVQTNADELIAHGTAPFVVVMPGGDYRADVDYAAFVLNDLLPYVEQHFDVMADRGDRAIGGLSMGGYWALKIAFTHPDQFVAVDVSSPVAGIGYPDDPINLAQTSNNLDRLHMAIDVGDADALVADAQQLTQALRARGLNVLSEVNPGGHTRAYWRSHTGEYLAFYTQSFRAAYFQRQHCYHLDQ